MKNVFVFLLCAAFFSCMAYKQSQSSANDKSIAISQLPTLPDEHNGAVWLPVTWQGKTYKVDMKNLLPAGSISLFPDPMPTPAPSIDRGFNPMIFKRKNDTLYIISNGDTLQRLPTATKFYSAEGHFYTANDNIQAVH